MQTLQLLFSTNPTGYIDVFCVKLTIIEINFHDLMNIKYYYYYSRFELK